MSLNANDREFIKTAISSEIGLIRQDMIHHKNGTKASFKRLEDNQNKIWQYQEKQNSQTDKIDIRVTNIETNPAVKPLLKKPYAFIILGILLLLVVFGFMPIDKILDLVKLIF